MSDSKNSGVQRPPPTPADILKMEVAMAIRDAEDPPGPNAGKRALHEGFYSTTRYMKMAEAAIKVMSQAKK